MKLSFFGAAQTVTGSKHLVTIENGENILLDCGMFQGLGKDTYHLNTDFGFPPSQINHLILSHAHVDHSGLIPKLVKDGFEGKIYCTPATFDLCKIMLADSAYIQEADARFVNKKKRSQGKPLVEPIYTAKDVDHCLKQFVPVAYNKEFKINDFIKLLFTDNGHILGSAAVHLKLLEGSETKHLTFTGDIGRYNSSLLKDPESFPQADVIISESTYGNRLHHHVDEAAQLILDAVVDTCSKKKGKLIIPAFSLGRTQEIVYALNRLDLHGLLPHVKIYVDSPLAINATNIMRKYVDSLNSGVQRFIASREDPFGFDKINYCTDKRDSQQLNFAKEPCVIISASGMAEAGRVKHHIMHAIENPINTILLVGYAEPLSLAGKLRNGDHKVTIYGDEYFVKAEVKIIDSYSAHGDYKEMIKFLSCQDPAKVQKMFLVHGDPAAQGNFKKELKEVGFNNIYIPDRFESFYV